ncbi:hypothetical protein ABIA73_001841 [Stenotrophomonas sp. 2694]
MRPCHRSIAYVDVACKDHKIRPASIQIGLQALKKLFGLLGRIAP